MKLKHHTSPICKLCQRFAEDILILFGNLMIWKYWITHRDKKVLVKMMNSHDLIMFFNSALQWIGLSKNRSLLSVSLTFPGRKLQKYLAASVCIPRFCIYCQWMLSPWMHLNGQSGDINKCKHLLQYAYFSLGVNVHRILHQNERIFTKRHENTHNEGK